MYDNFGNTIERYSEFLVEKRKKVLFGVLLAVALGTVGALSLSIQTTFRVWLHDDDPVLVNYERMTSIFGSDDTLLIAFSDEEGVLSNRTLISVDRMTKQLHSIEGVKRVDSLSNFKQLKATQPEHESPAMAVSQKWLALPGEKHQIILLDRDTGESRQLTGHEGLVEHLYLDPNENILVSGSIDRTIRIWDLESFKIKAILHGLPESISAIAVSQNHVYGGSLNSIAIWEKRTGKLVTKLAAHNGFVTGLLLTEDGKLVSASRSVELRDPANGKTIRVLTSHEKPVTQLLSLKGHIISAASDGKVIAHLSSGDTRTLINEPTLMVTALAASHDNHRLHAGMSDGSIRTVNLKDNETNVINVHEGWVLDLTEGPDGRIYSSSFDKNVAQITQGKKIILTAHRGPVRRVALSPDGKYLFTSGDGGSSYEWSLEQNRPLLTRFIDRRKAEPLSETSPIDGKPKGLIEVSNKYKHGIDIQIAGQSKGLLNAGITKTFQDIMIGPMTSCEEGCKSGQECDYEELEPVCSNPVLIEAFLPNTKSLVWSGIVFPSEQAPSVRIPIDDILSLQDVAESPNPKISRLGNFLRTFPEEPLRRIVEKHIPADSLPDEDFFISPQTAKNILKDLGTDKNASIALSELSQQRVNQYRLPLQPHRLRETKLHPHLHQTLSTNNYKVANLIKTNESVFPKIFSFDKDQTQQLMNNSAKSFDITKMDPQRDAQNRGFGKDTKVDYPYLDNATKLWSVTEDYVKSYLDAYYPTEEALNSDSEIHYWYNDLNKYIPNGVRQYAPEVTKENIAKLATLLIHTAAVEHENVGNITWNYTNLHQYIPSIVPADGSNPPVDIFQRYINTSILTFIPLNQLMDNFSHIALDQKGVACMKQYRENLNELQTEMEKKPFSYSALYPKALEGSVST